MNLLNYKYAQCEQITFSLSRYATHQSVLSCVYLPSTYLTSYKIGTAVLQFYLPSEKWHVQDFSQESSDPSVEIESTTLGLRCKQARHYATEGPKLLRDK